MATGLLNLDYDRIISQWGDSSMFSCDGSADELGELLQQLEDDTCDTQWLDCQDETSSTARPAPASLAAQQQRVAAQQAILKQEPQYRPAMAAQPAPKQQQQRQEQQQQQQQRHAPTSEGVVPSHSTQAPPPCWWDCAAMSDMGHAFQVKEEQTCRPAFDAFGNPLSPQLSAGRQNSSDQSACIVPDTSVPPPPPLASNPYGLVPQVLPPSPISYMCMPPMPMPPLLAMPAAAAALLQPQATQATALPEPTSDTQRLRQECLKRYRDKKARRMYTKMVRYQLRKINADKRPRIKGRFVKKTEEELAAAAGGAALPNLAAGTVSKDVSDESTTAADDCLSDSSL